MAIALSLLTAEVTRAPFDQLVCTFSANPKLHRITGNTLVEKVRFLVGLLSMESRVRGIHIQRCLPLSPSMD